MLFASICVAVVLAAGCSAHSMRAWPKASCNPRHGKLCFPDACQNTTCEHIQESVCIPDRCGCEARFFKFQKDNKMFHDVTRLCFANNNLKVSKAFIKDATSNRRVLTSTDLNSHADVTYKTFISLNLLASEALEAIAYRLRMSAQNIPTKANVRQFQEATEALRLLQRDRTRLGIRTKIEGSTFNETDYLAVKSVWKILMKDLKEALQIGKRMYAVLKEALPESTETRTRTRTETRKENVVLMDEETGETMDVQVPLEDEGSFADEGGFADVLENDLGIAEGLVEDEQSLNDVMEN